MLPHVKLTKTMRFGGLSQIIICPAGRCLLVLSEGAETVVVEVEEGEGSFPFRKGDPRIVEATLDDLVNEPSSNDYESYPDRY